MDESFDENEQRKALDARSGPGWTGVVAVVLVTLLTAGSVGVLVASRHGRLGSVASASRIASSPSPTASPGVAAGTVQLSAPSANVVWALVDYDALYQSTDRGGHWEKRTLPGNIGVRPSISFVSESEGWLLAPGSPTTECQEAPAEVWRTADGGETWQRLRSAGMLDAQCKNRIHFADSGHGFVSSWDTLHRPTIYSTADGGSTWRKATLPDGPLFVTQGGGFTLQVGWIKTFGGTAYLEASGTQDDATWHQRDFIFTSANGGVTWTWKQKLGSPNIVMVTETRWLQLLAPGQSMETVNGGQQFHNYDSDFSADNTAANPQVVFADANTGYAEGGGALQRSTDGGAHWVRVKAPGSATEPSPSPVPPHVPMPNDALLSAPTADVVWALLGGQYLFRSTDQGKTWWQRAWPHEGGGGRPVISFVNDNVGYVLFPGVPGTQCSQAGAQVWATHDAAATWNVVADVEPDSQDPQGLPFAQCKEYMYFFDAAHGFVAGHDTASRPTISRTADGGVTWTQTALADPPGFTTNGGGRSLQVVDMKDFGNVVYVVAGDDGGAHSYVFRSTDFGLSWSYRSTVPQGSLRVTFAAVDRWLLIGNDGSGQETTDLGQTWHAWANDYQDAAGVASTFVFATSQVGYGTVRGGIHRTLDGGAHWELIKTSWP